MIVKIIPSDIFGTVQAPASKSSMQRACAAALLRQGQTILYNPGRSNDDMAAIDVIRTLGASVSAEKETLVINGSGYPAGMKDNDSTVVNCGESGLGFRMFAPVAALSTHEIILNGSGSLLKRPMDFFDEIFPQLGISIQSNNGRLPIKIKGPLTPADITIDGSLSSQFLTGLMMAFARSCTKPVTITVKDLTSKPYIDLTISVMKHFGWNVEHSGYKKFYFTPQLTGGHNITYTVEGDWSGGAFLLVAGAIAGSITVNGLDKNSTQADTAILTALAGAGAPIDHKHNAVSIGKGSLIGFEFDATQCPDLFPPLVALASCCNGITSIKGVHRLTHKESNRTVALQDEFGKMGIKVDVNGDVMKVTGETIKGAEVHSHHDHRIAMACAVAALHAEGETVIHDAEAVNKSYPAFYEDLVRMNAGVKMEAS